MTEIKDQTENKAIAEYQEELDPEKVRKFNEYLDDVLPSDPTGEHPFNRFTLAEIVISPEHGHGIITGFKIHDTIREMEGLGVQFVPNNVMGVHQVFTPDESLELTPTGIIFHGTRHADMALEKVVELETGQLRSS